MMNFELKLNTHPFRYLHYEEVESLLRGSKDSKYSKIKRLIEDGKLLHIRRGLYCLTEAFGHKLKPHPFELAQHIYGPSLISLESALSFHGLIPETVYTITSTCTKRSKEFKTPLGIFNYFHMPVENFYQGAELIDINNSRFFMAKPWKAICDYIYCYKKNWTGITPLLESLRITLEDLPVLDDNEIELLIEYYQHKRLTKFLKHAKQDLMRLDL